MQLRFMEPLWLGCVCVEYIPASRIEVGGGTGQGCGGGQSLESGVDMQPTSYLDMPLLQI